MDIEPIINNVNTFNDFVCKKSIMAINTVCSIILGYFAYIVIQALPNPHTVTELIKYMFSNFNDYAKAMGLTLIASIFIFSLGLSFIVYGIKRFSIYTVLRIFTILFGAIIIVSALYIFKFFLLLFFALLLVGIIGILLIEAFDS